MAYSEDLPSEAPQSGVCPLNFHMSVAGTCSRLSLPAQTSLSGSPVHVHDLCAL